MEQSGWCPDNAICLDWIERRAAECVENSIDIDTIYMSNDVYIQFMKQILAQTRFHSPGTYHAGYMINSVNTCAGNLIIKSVPQLCNFCYIGSEASYKRLEWEKISQEFEKIVFGVSNEN